MPRGLLVGATFQVAEDHGDPEPLGQPVDLLVQHVLQVVVILDVRGPRLERPRPARACAVGPRRSEHTRPSAGPPDGATGPAIR